FFRKPTVAAVYTGEKLKRLLDQRWTGHLATVTVIMKSFEHIVHLLREIEDNQTSAAEVRIESTGILKAITQPSFQFIACMMYQILSLLDPPNTALQAKSTDLYTGVRLVQSALVCVEELRCDSQFDTLWDKFTKDRETIEPLAAAPPKKQGRVMSHLRDYVVDTTVGHRPEGLGEKTECKILYFSTLDSVVGEMTARFGERNSKLVEALCTLHPGSEYFLDANKVRPLLDLTGTEMKEAEFAVARQFLQEEMSQSDKNWTTQDILRRYCEPLAAMPTIEILLDVQEVKQQLMKRRRSRQASAVAAKGGLSAKSMIRAQSIAASILNMSENDLADIMDTDQVVNGVLLGALTRVQQRTGEGRPLQAPPATCCGVNDPDELAEAKAQRQVLSLETSRTSSLIHAAGAHSEGPGDQEWLNHLNHILQQKIPSAGQLMEAVRVKMKERKVLTEELATLATPVSEKA
ncbi:hypothetical protein JOQ06_013073, partial [Pogonophryne albipinna]